MMKNDAQNLARSPDEIVAEIARLMDEAEAMLTGPEFGRAGEEVISLRERLDDLRLRCGEVLGDLRRKAAHSARCADDAIRSHPYEAAALALGVGVLLGVVWRSQRAR